MKIITSALPRIRNRLRSGEPLRIQFFDPFDFKVELLDQKRPGAADICNLDIDGDQIAGSVDFLVRFQLQLRRLHIRVGAEGGVGGGIEAEEWESTSRFSRWRHLWKKFDFSSSIYRRSMDLSACLELGEKERDQISYFSKASQIIIFPFLLVYGF